MAKANPKTKSLPTERRMRVYCAVNRGRRHPRPWDPEGARISLNGHWVSEAGFPQGATIVVDIQYGKLVITRAPEPDVPTCKGCASRALKRHVHAHAVS